MDARAVVEAHPAGLERILRPGRDDLAREAAGPSVVRHVPGRVDLLVVDGVGPGRRLQPLHPDGDGVALCELQVLPQAQGELAAVDGDERRIARGEVGGRDARLRPPHRRPQRRPPAAVDLVLDHVAKPRLLHAHPVLPSDLDERTGRGLYRRVLGGAVDRLRGDGDEVPQLAVRVADLRAQVAVDVIAGRVAPDAGRQAARPARRLGRRDHAIEIGANVEPLRAQDVAIAVGDDDDRPSQRLDEPAVELLAGLVRGKAADRDAADLDPVGDLVLLRLIPGVRAHRGADQHHKQGR